MSQCKYFVRTVNGDIEPNKLGYCQSHEHLFIADGQSRKVVKSLYMDSLEKSVQELEMYYSYGGRSLVDAQPVGCGRMADYLKKASILSNVNIIASTGFHKLVFYPQEHWINKFDADKLFEIFLSEIDVGMFVDCDIKPPFNKIDSKAGIIKTASDYFGIEGRYELLFEVASEVAKKSGASILCHTEMGKHALKIAEFFLKKGISPESIIICHLDRVLDDVDYILDVANTGVFLEFDTIGRFKYHSDEVEARFLHYMVEKGFEDRILIGLDTTNERLKSYGGQIGLDHIINQFIPLLKTIGLDDSVIQKFVYDNPMKALSIKRSNA